MNLEEIDETQERWAIPRGEALDAAANAVLEKLLAVKGSMESHSMESQRKAAKEEVDFLEGVIDILNQVKTEKS